MLRGLLSLLKAIFLKENKEEAPPEVERQVDQKEDALSPEERLKAVSEYLKGSTERLSSRPKREEVKDDSTFMPCEEEVTGFLRERLLKKGLHGPVSCNGVVFAIKYNPKSSVIHVLIDSKSIAKISFSTIGSFRVFSNRRSILLLVKGIKKEGEPLKTFVITNVLTKPEVACSLEDLSPEAVNFVKATDKEFILDVSFKAENGKVLLKYVCSAGKIKVIYEPPPDFSISEKLATLYVSTKSGTPFERSIALQTFLEEDEAISEEDLAFVASLHRELSDNFVYLLPVLIKKASDKPTLLERLKRILLSVEPVDKSRVRAKAKAFRALGEVFLEKGDKKEALLLFKRALALDPGVGVKKLAQRLEKELNEAEK